MSSPSRTEFGAPFDFPDADLILLTSDNTTFAVHKGLLSFASATIRAFPFELSSDASDSQHGLPVFPFVSETALGIEHTLRFIYPMKRPVWTTLSEVHTVLEIARKYDMDGVTQAVGEILSTSDFLRERSFGVYALACGYALEDLAKLAARRTLSMRLGRLGEKEPTLLNAAGGEAIYRLMQYRTACFDLVSFTLEWSRLKPILEGHMTWAWIRCSASEETCSKSSLTLLRPDFYTATVRKWWCSFLEQLREELQKSLDLDIFNSADFLTTAWVPAGSCDDCRRTASANLKEFMALI